MGSNSAEQKERKRLYGILAEAGVPKQNQDSMSALIDNMAFLRVRLDEIRAEIEGCELVVPFNNGGGQKGIRINPSIKLYSDLFKLYITAFKEFSASIPKDLQAEIVGREKTVLDVVKGMKMKA